MIKIGIVDDHEILRKGLRNFLFDHEDLRVTGEASNGREALDLVRNFDLDVLILDLSMPGYSGLDALASLRARAPKMGILIFTGQPEQYYALSLLRKGASGYLTKDCDPSEIVRAIRIIAAGRKYLTAAVADLLAQQVSPQREEQLPHERLAEREFQIFFKVAKGESVGKIAESLSLSAKSVVRHRAAVMRKLALASNSDVTYYALKHNLIQ